MRGKSFVKAWTPWECGYCKKQVYSGIKVKGGLLLKCDCGFYTERPWQSRSAPIVTHPEVHDSIHNWLVN